MIVRVGAFAGFVSAWMFAAAVSDPAHLAAMAVLVGLLVAVTVVAGSRPSTVIPVHSLFAASTHRTVDGLALQPASVDTFIVNRR